MGVFCGLHFSSRDIKRLDLVFVFFLVLAFLYSFFLFFPCIIIQGSLGNGRTDYKKKLGFVCFFIRVQQRTGKREKGKREKRFLYHRHRYYHHVEAFLGFCFVGEREKKRSLVVFLLVCIYLFTFGGDWLDGTLTRLKWEVNASLFTMVTFFPSCLFLFKNGVPPVASLATMQPEIPKLLFLLGQRDL